MGWTKMQLVKAAFEEMGLADYVFDLSPEQIQSALLRQDSMIGRWKGVNIHWPFEAPNDISGETDTNCPDYAVEAIILNLAVRLAPSYGKSLSPATLAHATTAFDTLSEWSADLPPVRQLPAMLLGTGNKRHGSMNIMTTSTEEPLIKKGNEITF